MSKILNTVSVTLLVALVSVVPATLLGHYLPRVFEPSLQRLAIAAWMSGIASWFIAKSVARNEQEAMRQASSAGKNTKMIALSVAVFAFAAGLVIALRFYGQGLLRYL